MKADLYVQGHFWGTIDVPGDGLLALLAKGMITEAQRKAEQLRQDLDSLDGVSCSISLRLKEPVTYSPHTSDHAP
ncbi:unnamed protein product [marine sediment metagenome]|uniref:Uncharacterized protein n=1 Tax=marine sediment metagenome TaxID=412755 RepID=X1TK13_9ZZZZ